MDKVSNSSCGFGGCAEYKFCFADDLESHNACASESQSNQCPFLGLSYSLFFSYSSDEPDLPRALSYYYYGLSLVNSKAPISSCGGTKDSTSCGGDIYSFFDESSYLSDLPLMTETNNSQFNLFNNCHEACGCPKQSNIEAENAEEPTLTITETITETNTFCYKVSFSQKNINVDTPTDTCAPFSFERKLWNTSQYDFNHPNSLVEGCFDRSICTNRINFFSSSASSTCSSLDGDPDSWTRNESFPYSYSYFYLPDFTSTQCAAFIDFTDPNCSYSYDTSNSYNELCLNKNAETIYLPLFDSTDPNFCSDISNNYKDLSYPSNFSYFR
jgi:hypothetical protein